MHSYSYKEDYSSLLITSIEIKRSLSQTWSRMRYPPVTIKAVIPDSVTYVEPINLLTPSEST